MKPNHQPNLEIIRWAAPSVRSNSPIHKTTIPIAIGTPIFAWSFILLLFLINATVHAGNYTWNGSTSTNWSTSSNWSPAGVPNTNDTVTLSNGGVNSILLDGNRTITRLVISANTIDLNTYELHVSGRSSLNGGAINNGNLKIRGTYAYFQGTNFDCTLDVIAGQIKFSGGAFDKTGAFEQNGTASGWGLGGCVFNDDVTIKNTGSVYLRMGQDAGDTFNGKVYLYSGGGYSLQMAYGDTSYFNDTIYINSTGSGGISFANGTYGASILGDSACLITGSSGISAGTIQFKNMVQSATSSNSITASGSVLFNVYSNSFLGKVNFTAPNLVVKSTTFGDSTSLTKTGHTLNNTWDGANVYNGVVTITNGNTSTAYVKLASQNADTYNKDVYFNAGSGAIQAANAGTNIYNGNVSVNGNNVTFNTSGGTLKFAGEQNQEFGGGTNTLTFNKLIVDKLGGSVTLNQPITIDSLLQLTSGIIYTDTIITLKASATTTGASNQSFVEGTVKKIGNTAFVFPVGNDGVLSPIEISAPSQVTDAFTARKYLNPQTYGDSKDSTIHLLSTCTYWTLTRTTGTSKVYVKLFWDSLRCTLYDTSGLGVASWNGTKWDDLGSDGMNGNVLSGEITSDTTSNSYIAFTWAYRTSSTTNTSKTLFSSPVLNLGATGSWNHPISEDYFGYNGANILDAGQYYSDLASDPNNFNLPVLKNNGISTIRLNGGTFGNYWDWRTGWFIPEDKLPNDWYYTRMSHKKEFPNPGSGNPFVNDMSLFKISSDIVGARPIFQLNSLTSSFNYEVASLYRAGELNLPVKYIELGNEFYLGDEQFKDVFPSSLDYINYATEFTNDLKLKAPFSTTQVAVVGASTPNGIPGRRALWLDVILQNINKYPTHRPDAITIHEYYASGLKDPIATTPLANSTIGRMLQKPFSRRDDMFADELNDIALTNSQFNLNPPLEVWLTEYNLDESEGNNVGTWAHGLFNAIQTLTYLESPLITHISSHAMTSNAVFGNIFENEKGFTAMTSGQLPHNIGDPELFATEKYGFTASGAALNEIALALKGQNVVAHRIDFSNLPINYIQYYKKEPPPTGSWVTTNYLDLYGWCFEKEGGTEAIILNLGPTQYDFEAFDEVGYYNGGTVDFESMVQLTSSDQTAGNGGVALLSTFPTDFDDPLFTTTEKIITNPISSTYPLELPGYSLTRLIYRDPNKFSIRLTDDEICEGSETSVIITGKPFGATCTIVCSSSTQTISFPSPPNTTTDSVIVLSGLPKDNYTITAIAGSVTSPNAPTLTVHAPISVNITTIPNPINLCSTNVTLNAIVSMTSGSLGNSYSYLWIPENHVELTPSSIDVDLTELTTEAYQVFVYNGECWASSAPKVIERSPISVDLGNSFTTCASQGFILDAQVVKSPYSAINTYKYKLTVDNDPPISQTTSDFSITSGLSAGLHTCLVEVWLDDGGFTFSTCPATTDVITINVVNCCSCSSNVVSLLPNSHENYTTYGHPHETYIDETSLINAASASSNFFTNIPIGGGVKKTVTITGLSSTNSTFCLNGELWLRSELFATNKHLETLVLQKCTLKLGPDAKIRIRGKVTLVLEGCIIEKCDGSTEMWDGIYADIEDEATAEPEIVIDQFGTQPTQIRDAKNAIVIRRDSPYRIQHGEFTDNYIDIKFEKCKKITNQGKSGISSTDMSTNNYIRSCTFTSAGNTLLTPYNTAHKFSAITLNDVERLVIGDSSLNSLVQANIFEKSRFGVFSNNSSLEVFNNSFIDLEAFDEAIPSGLTLHWPKLTFSSIGIYNLSAFDFNDRNLTVGEHINFSGSDTRNYFSNIKYGIYSQNESKVKIRLNDFGVGNEDFDNGSIGVSINYPGNKMVDISNKNEFKSYTYGILVHEISSGTTLSVNNNKFYYGWTNFNGYTGTGISILNASPIKPLLAEIKGNILGDYLNSTFYFPRIGIRAAKIIGVNIANDNQIYFNLSTTPSGYYSGIWLQDCDRAKITGNKLININLPSTLYTLEELLVGLRIDESHGTCIEWNSMEALGQGMRFQGNSLVYSLYKNTITNFDRGIYLNKADIGSIQGMQLLSTRNDLDNSWVRSATPTTDRIQGKLMNNTLPIDWYTRSTSAADDRWPHGPIAVVSPKTFSTSASSVSQCPVELSDDPPYSYIARNAWFGSITGDSARDDENYYNQFKYVSESTLFNELKSYPALLAMGDSSNESFQDFYEDRLNSNYALFDSVDVLIKYGFIAEALELVEGINDTNDIEFCLKKVFQLYLNSRINEVDFSSSDSLLLDSIAELNAITTGPGVIMARILLNREKYDYLSIGSRLLSPIEKDQMNLLDIYIYPNPTTTLLNVVPTIHSENISIYIKDITGRTLLNKINQLQIETSTLTSGIYLLEYEAQGQRVVKKFEIIK